MNPATGPKQTVWEPTARSVYSPQLSRPTPSTEILDATAGDVETLSRPLRTNVPVTVVVVSSDTVISSQLGVE